MFKNKLSLIITILYLIFIFSNKNALAVLPPKWNLIRCGSLSEGYVPENMEEVCSRYDEFHSKYEEILNATNLNPTLENLYDSQICAQKMAILSSYMCQTSNNSEFRSHMQNLANIFSMNQKILLSRYYMKKAIESPSVENWENSANLKGIVGFIFANGNQEQKSYPFIYDYYISKANASSLMLKWESESHYYKKASKIVENLKRFDLKKDCEFKIIIAESKVTK